MSRASISTGGVLFNSTTGKSPSESPKSPIKEGQAMHIALIGDYSGRGSRGASDHEKLAKRRAIEIDRDNFEEVFTSLNVSLQLPICDEPIAFNEYDDLHPDVLVENVPLFSRFRTLKRRLKNPDLFHQAADEIQKWSEFKHEVEDDLPVEEGIPLPTDMLGAVLSQSQTEIFDRSPSGDIDKMIKDIIAPYVEKKADPRLSEYEEAVDEATSESLRKIIHDSEFQKLESAWRSVYLLVRRLDTNRKLKLFLVDISEEELKTQLETHENLEDSALYDLFVKKYQVPGATPFSLLQFNCTINESLEDIRVASAFANLAHASGAKAIAGANENIAGCRTFDGRDDVEELYCDIDEDFTKNWQSFREQAQSASLALALPKFLVRLPYGKRTSPIESFNFDELGENNQHHYYCWANASYLVTLLLAQSYSQFGADYQAGQIIEIEDLPLHIYQDEDGDSVAKACAEFFIRDSVVAKFAEHGLLTLRSVKGQANAIVPQFRTVSVNGTSL